jgi:hypothetical protein
VGHPIFARLAVSATCVLTCAFPASSQTQTPREVAFGVNYDVTRNVRLMSNVTMAVDDRPSTVALLTRLQLVF